MNSNFFHKNEYRALESLYRHSPRNPRQMNSFNSADVETIRLGRSKYLVTSTDTIAIEIHSGLYKDPQTWGYLAVANSVSDLAASGAKPIGILVSAQWEKAHQGKIQAAVYKSLSRALTHFQVPLIGGDSGSSGKTMLTTTVFGQTFLKPLSRIGVRPGDLILTFGDFTGFGPALAFDYLKFKNRNRLENFFRPCPSWQTINKFRKYFRASIDSSDGLHTALVTLAQVNEVHFMCDLAELRLTKAIQRYQKKYNIPIEYFFESDLGDLQSCVAISPRNYDLIKHSLPFHQKIAIATLPKPENRTISYKFQRSDKTLLNLIEKNKDNYLPGLNQWLKQFPRITHRK